MEMPDHQQFADAVPLADRRLAVAARRSGERLDGVVLPPDQLGFLAGERLLLSAARALAQPASASVDIELQPGTRLEGVIALRLNGPVAEASRRRGIWEHGFRIDAVTGFSVRLLGD